MKISILLLSILLTSFFCFSQTKFQLAIGGSNGDIARSIIQTSDKGYAIAGYSSSLLGGGSFYIDMYIVKLDSNGFIQWSKTVGGNKYDDAFSIIQTNDGGYAIAGEAESLGAGSFDMYIIKLDENGSLQWNKTVGSTNNDWAYNIIQTSDSGYMVTGCTNSFGAGGFDMYIVKLDANGSLQWSKTIGGTNDDWAYYIIQTSDSGYAVAGSSSSFGAGNEDMYIVKLSSIGTLQWSKVVGGVEDDYAFSIIQTTDGSYAVTGSTHSYGAGNGDTYIVKLTNNGSLQWCKTVGGVIFDDACSIIQTPEGGYAVGGETYSFGAGSYDLYILKLTNNGSLQWSRTIGGTNTDRASTLIKTFDSGYVMVGSTESFGVGVSKIYIVKFDSGWNTCGNISNITSLSDTGGMITSPISTVTSPPTIINSPSPTVGSRGTRTQICFTSIQQITNKIPVTFKLYQNYPNPFNPSTKIKFDIPSNVKGEMSNVEIIIYDILGKEVSTLVNEHLKPGRYEVEWDARQGGSSSELSSGVYYYKLVSGDFVESKKMVLVK